MTAEDSHPQTWEFAEAVQIGRSPDCQIQVDPKHVEVSRRHARLQPGADGWTVRDRSQTGTLLNGRRIPREQDIPLQPEDELRIGPVTIRVNASEHPAEPVVTGATLAGEINVTSADMARLDPLLVLDSVMELPERFGDAQTEEEVLQCACDYLVKVFAPAIDCAAALEVSDLENPLARVLAIRSGIAQSLPLVSRRIMASLVENEDAVILYQQRNAEQGIAATVGEDTRSVGACLIERGVSGSCVVIYVLGEGTIGGGEDLAAGYLKLVSTLTRQHITARRRASLGKYFSPKVVQLLMQPDGRSLAEGSPQLAETTSLFFDLRGFSLSAEASAHDLLPLHDHLRSVMDVVAEEVFRTEGTIIDYQGDGCFAAWGIPFAQADHATAAVRCALRIVERLGAMETPFNSAHTGSPCGIGIASGQTLSGSVGANAHFKYGVLGPSVNLAARLESLTKPKRLHAPILVSEAVVAALDPADAQHVRVARVEPAGMETQVDVYEVLPPGRDWDGNQRARWHDLLSDLEAARTTQQIAQVRDRVRDLPPADPRTAWIESQCERLTNAATLSTWDGIVRYAK